MLAPTTNYNNFESFLTIPVLFIYKMKVSDYS